MMPNVHCSPLRPPPNTWSETTPNSTGASDWASDRSTVRVASARPQSSAGTISRRAASIGGFWADSMRPARIRYGRAVTALRVVSAGMNSTVARQGAHGRHQDAGVEKAPPQQPVAQAARDQHADDRPAADDQQQQVGQGLVDLELLPDELGPEGLDAGQVEVPAGAGDDQDDVGADAQHRPHRRRRCPSAAAARRRAPCPGRARPPGPRPGAGRRWPGGVFAADRAAPERQSARRGRRPRPSVGAVWSKRGDATSGRLGQPEHEPGQKEGRQGQQHEGRPPRQGGDVAGHREADAGADQLAGEDVAVDAAALGSLEVVADQRRHHRAGGGGDRAEHEAGQDQPAEGGDGGAPDHGHPPGGDGQPEDPGAAAAVGHHAERQAGHGGDQRADRDQQADVGVADVQGGPQRAAAAPTVEASALLRARMAASARMTRVRSWPPEGALEMPAGDAGHLAGAAADLVGAGPWHASPHPTGRVEAPRVALAGPGLYFLVSQKILSISAIWARRLSATAVSVVFLACAGGLGGVPEQLVQLRELLRDGPA